MTELVLDTSVLSMFAPGRRPPTLDAALGDMRRTEDEWRLPTIVVAELCQGVSKLRRAGAMNRADRLDEWINETLESFRDRLLPLTVDVALETGRLADRLRAEGAHPGLADVIIAATASVRGAVVLTLNLKHFVPIGIRCVNPFQPGALAQLAAGSPPRATPN